MKFQAEKIPDTGEKAFVKSQEEVNNTLEDKKDEETEGTDKIREQVSKEGEYRQLKSSGKNVRTDFRY